MHIFGITGWSGSGKTHLMRRLLPELISRQLKVSTIKHAHHAFDLDQPGKDSYEHRAAGATEVLVSSAKRWALVHELRDEAELTLPDIIDHLSPVDLVLIEGFKSETHDKLEVHRPEIGRPLLAPNDARIVAVATDDPEHASLKHLQIPILKLGATEEIANFIIRSMSSSANIAEKV